MTDIVKSSFNTTYALLMTTGTITFIEALRTDDIPVRHIMNVETCISLVACFFYSKFNEMIKDKVDYHEITVTRYVDWSITTPMMILSLLLFISYNLNLTKDKSIDYVNFLILVIINYFMLATGYMGETGRMEQNTSLFTGFIFFALLFGLIYIWYIKDNDSMPNQVIYWLYVIIWSLYGVVVKFKPEWKNIMYNVLDLIAKCFVGLGFWAYLVKIFN